MKTNDPFGYRYMHKKMHAHKPCMPGDHVHITRWQGCYKVDEVSYDYFVVYKNRKPVQIYWHEFVCLQGEGKSPEAAFKRLINHQLHLNELSNERLKSFLKEIKGGK